MTRATVNTDASFCPRTKAGGWACWIAIDGGLKIKKSGVFHKRPKSAAEAEFWAMLNGAWLAAHNGATNLLVQGDCTGALKKLRLDTPERRALFVQIPHKVTIRTKWVKAHKHTETARHWVNDWCDKQAKRHMRAQRKDLDREKTASFLEKHNETTSGN